MSEASGQEPGTRPDADRSHPEEQEQQAQHQTYPGPTPDTRPPGSAQDADMASETADTGQPSRESTPYGLADEEPAVPDPLEPVPGVEQGTRSRQVAGASGDNELPPVSDAEHGGKTPLEPPD
jgi:hypothetical protein